MTKRTKEQLAAYHHTWATKLRLEVLSAYGSVCACCGEDEPRFLTIDHINNDGAAHRREIGYSSGTQFYAWLRHNDWPDGLQVLCYNCNNAKARGGCPHE